MKTAEIKSSSSASNLIQAKRQPFFTKEGQGSFFSKFYKTPPSFFSLATIQPKLTIGQPNDKYEVEADAMADKVVQRLSTNNNLFPSGMTDGNNTIHTKCAECEEEHKLRKKEDMELSLKPIFESNGESPEDNLQMKSLESHFVQTKCSNCEGEEIVQAKSEEESSINTRTLESNLNDSNGNGRPLSPQIRNSMGSAFHADFSRVRVHTDNQAVQMNKELKAQAFTHGNDIYFNQAKYNTNSTSGKHLLAHELTHTIQQKSVGTLQRVCDAAALGTRTEPIFFPNQRDILRVYQGSSTLRKWGGRRHAVGLVQQALIDLGFNLGTFGPNGDGADRKYGPVTEAAILSFQTREGISSNAGVIDQETLKCLDEIRSKLVVPAHQSGSVVDNQYLIDREKTDGRDEDIFFARGSSTLDVGDQLKIAILMTRKTKPIKGCNLTLGGFVSEDELAMFGQNLATDRINAVNNELVRQNHDEAGPNCFVPPIPIRTPDPRPSESSGVSDYPDRRKVEIVPHGQTSTTPSCTDASPEERSLTPTEDADLAPMITEAAKWVDTALNKLVPGNTEGDEALTTYFGGSSNRTTIKSNLDTWKDHISKIIPNRSQVGTECNDTCRLALAFNNGRDGKSMMTLCPGFFGAEPVNLELPGLKEDQRKTFLILHEAGHGSIGTRDSAYVHRRLIEFLAEYPSLAENNTDSYTLMILCLNAVGSFCDAPVTSDQIVGFSNPAEEEKAHRGIAWLQTWLEFSLQDTSGVFTNMDEARNKGVALDSVHVYYSDIYDLIIQEFGIRRPPGKTAPTFNEQTTVAAILDRLISMERATRPGLGVEKDTTTSLNSRWSPGPGRKVTFDNNYFLLSLDRTRVETILPLLIEATTAIDSSMRLKYGNLIKAIIAQKHNDQP